jgi:hypothetical protein
MSGYVINVSLHGVHFFATRESNLFGPRLKMLIDAIESGFPAEKGYKVGVTYWKTVGEKIDKESIGIDDLSLTDFERGYVLIWSHSIASRGVVEVGKEFVLRTGEVLICRGIEYGDENKNDVIFADTKDGVPYLPNIIDGKAEYGVYRHKLRL